MKVTRQDGLNGILVICFQKEKASKHQSEI